MSEKKVLINVGEFNLHYLSLENWDGRNIDVFVLGWPVTIRVIDQENNEIMDQKEMYIGFRLTRQQTDRVFNGEELTVLRELHGKLGSIYLYELSKQYCEQDEEWRECGDSLKSIEVIAEPEVIEKFKRELEALIDKKKTEIKNIVSSVVKCILSDKEECEY